MIEMTSPEKPQRHWLRNLIIGFVSLFVLVSIGLFAFEVVSSQRGMWQEQSQIDTSSGRIRYVKTRANVEEADKPRDTFISLQLKGRTIAPKPDWRPMTTHWGLGFSGSHGHTGTDRSWKRLAHVERLWNEGGFTDEARTASAIRMLELLKSDSAGVSNDYRDAIQVHIDSMQATPIKERVTNLDDIQRVHDLLDTR